MVLRRERARDGVIVCDTSGEQRLDLLAFLLTSRFTLTQLLP
jgi:hypothetical protein